MSRQSRQLVCSACQQSLRLFPSPRPHLFRQYREFSMGRPQLSNPRQSYGSRMREALSKTRIQWYAIPAGLGIAFLGVAHFYTVVRRNQAQQEEEAAAKASNSYSSSSDGEQGVGKPKKRKRIRPSGPWQVQIMSTLPLKALSRLWGRFNELVIPYYLRVPGFKLYSWIFGVNLSEVEEPDLHKFPNLAAFFYRTLKPGLRPIDPNPNGIVSPADGRIIQFGIIEDGEVEQVKGMTYSLDALLGKSSPSSSGTSTPKTPFPPELAPTEEDKHDSIRAHEEFAQVNGITYTLPNLLAGKGKKNQRGADISDQSTTPKSSSEAEVRADLALSSPWFAPHDSKSPSALYYCVIYLAPGDYHRFHSPVPWVVEQRRHFAGELYSVSPYLQRTLPGLFTLNERVVLLGKWRWGFFSYTPVGATNVGSIVINFDKELRTNSLTTDTLADRAAEAAAEKGEQWVGYAEATYDQASDILSGYPLKKGEEMGGFQLGSTIVLVFEAPKGRRLTSFDQGYFSDQKAGWTWSIEKGQKVKVGEALGSVIEVD